MGLFFADHYHRHEEHVTKYPNKIEVSVTEKRAPTDDSIRLWDEYLEKARKSVMASYKIETAIVNIIAVAFNNGSNSADMQPMQYRLKYNLNGVEENVSFEIDSIEAHRLSRMQTEFADQEIVKIIFDKVSRMIAIRMLKSMKTVKLGTTRELNGH